MAIDSTDPMRGRARRRVLLRFVALTACVATALGMGAAGPAVADSAAGGPSHASVLRPGAARAASGSAGHAQPSAARLQGIRYAVLKRVCPAATSTRPTCMAVRLVPAAKGTKHAMAYLAPSVATGPAGGYTPADLASAYGYNPSSGGSTQTVAIVDAFDDPNVRSDLNAFDHHYGLPPETLTSIHKVNQNGSPTPRPVADVKWALEITLDVETVRAACVRCKILLVEAGSPSSTDLATAADLATAVNTAARLGATEITNSYGIPEDPGAPTSVQAAYNHPGVVITASTGDDGWYSWDLANQADGTSDDAPNTPATYPNVVAVGGTRLALNTDGTRQAEDVWNGNGPDDGNNGLGLGASGGGCSTVYAARGWQAQVANYAKTGCGAKRLAGDIAADADPSTGFDVYDTYGTSGWLTVGGTSLSSPLIAAMWALAGGSGGVAYPAQSLYDNLRFRPTAVFDVTQGGNAFCGGDSQAHCSSVLRGQTNPPTGNPNNLADGVGFPAGLLDCGFPFNGSAGPPLANNRQCVAATGYDGPSGVGTPKGLTVFESPRPKVAIKRPSILTLRTAERFSAVGFTDPLPGGNAVSYSWHWGDGTVSTTAATSASHVYTKAGARIVTLFATDDNPQTATATSKITMGVPPTARIAGPASLRRLSSGRFSGGHSTDSNTGGSLAIYSWHWGDGTTSRGAAAYHRYAHTGTYTVTLIVVDNAGLRGSSTLRVSVHS